MAKKSSKRTIVVELDHLTYVGLIQMAAYYGGMIPNDLAAQYVERSIMQEKLDDVPPMVELYKLHNQIATQRGAKEYLLGIGAHLLENPEDERYELFENLCVSFGYTVEDILSEASNAAHEILLSVDYGNTKTARAITFLREKLKSGTRVPARVLIDLAGREGISEFVLKAAKKAMGVESERAATCFVWYLPEGLQMRNPSEDLREVLERFKRRKEEANTGETHVREDANADASR